MTEVQKQVAYYLAIVILGIAVALLVAFAMTDDKPAPAKGSSMTCTTFQNGAGGGWTCVTQ